MSRDIAAGDNGRPHRELPTQVRNCRDLPAVDELFDPPAEEAPEPPPRIPGFAKLRAEFIERQRGALGVLREAIARHDFKKVRTIGHNLKGTGTPYGFPKITEYGRALEASALTSDFQALEVAAGNLGAYLKSLRIP